MPVKLTIDHVGRTANAIAVGPIDLNEVREHLDGERTRGGLPYREFIDATRAKAAFDAADARDIVEMLRRLGRRKALGPTAVVVSDDVSYGMLRMVEILLGDIAAVKPFRAGEELEARQWLENAPIRGNREEDAS
jgi:hypothetical protein